MLQNLFAGIDAGNIIGAAVAWRLASGTWAIIPWAVIILGWRIGDMLLPPGMMNLTPLHKP